MNLQGNFYLAVLQPGLEFLFVSLILLHFVLCLVLLSGEVFFFLWALTLVKTLGGGRASLRSTRVSNQRFDGSQSFTDSRIFLLSRVYFQMIFPATRKDDEFLLPLPPPPPPPSTPHPHASLSTPTKITLCQR